MRFLVCVCIPLLISSFGVQHRNVRTDRTFLKAVTDDVGIESELTTSGSESFRAPAYEIDRRRNFAIISHPDAGKTTLTEKLLLFGGAIQDAGAVKARGDQRKVTSDWMEIEKARLVGGNLIVMLYLFYLILSFTSRNII